jgi:hypothetical protein
MGPLLDPVDVQLALCEEPATVDLHEGVVVPERSNHQASLATVDRQVMRHGVGLARGALGRQRENGALSDEMLGGGVLVQVVEDGSQRLARVEVHRGRRIRCIHVHDEVRIRCEEGHLTLGVAAIRAVCIALDELSDREAIRGLVRGDGDVLAHADAKLPPGVRRVPRWVRHLTFVN